MNDQSCADFRAALADALSAAEAGGLPAAVQITLMLSELGRLIAKAGGDGLEVRLAHAFKALEHATRTALQEVDNPVGGRFAQRPLN